MDEMNVNQPIVVGNDFFDHEPTKAEKIEMRKTSRTVSGWIYLLCRDWAAENRHTVDNLDIKFLDYKPFLKGQLTSQLLCRLCIPDHHQVRSAREPVESSVDFWNILGVHDDFDKSYIISQVERFCALYSICGILPEDDIVDTSSTGIQMSIGGPCLGPTPTYATNAEMEVGQGTEQNQYHLTKGDQRRISSERREARIREREAATIQKMSEKAAKEATREERRQKKIMLRQQRESFLEEQKNAALQRAAELVQSNRVPIEITRGAAAAQAAANAAVAMMGVPSYQNQEAGSRTAKKRSAIVVSTASDLDQIVTHAKNLFTKYNAIAKEHNQKVNWATVAKELGIHVKVREKYSRMHARALQRGFDFSKHRHYKVKENPQIFLNPLTADEKIKFQSQHQSLQEHHDNLVLHEENKDVSHAVSSISDDQVAAAVDAAIKTVPVSHGVANFDDAAAAASAVDAAMKIPSVDGDGHPVDQQVFLSVEDVAAAALAAHDGIDPSSVHV